MKTYGEVRSGKRNKWLNFGDDLFHDPTLVEECLEYDDCLWILVAKEHHRMADSPIC